MAQTLKFGNGNFATKAGSTLCYDDQNGNFKPIPMDFTRASTATRVNKQGLIEVVKSNVPRIDYTDTTNGVLLLEKAATNLVTYSEYFSNGSWNKESGNQVINSNVETSPSNTLTADKLTVSSGSITTRKLWYQQSTTSGSEYTFSVYVKSVTGQVNTGFISIAYLDANINETYFTATDIWQRVVVTATANATTTRFLITGDPNCQIYIWGAMLEQNSVASSYIPSQGSASTRVAETANGAGNSEVFNDSEGVLFCDIAALVNSDTPRAISISDGTLNNRVYMYYSTNNVLEVTIKVSGTDQASFSSTLSDSTLFNKLALKYKLNDFALWINGFEVDFDLSGSVFSTNTLDRLNLSYPNEIYNLYAKTKEIGYYDTILTDLELETLTSYKSWTSMVNELNLNIIYNG
mgnify:CR=1 FL=1